MGPPFAPHPVFQRPQNNGQEAGACESGPLPGSPADEGGGTFLWPDKGHCCPGVSGVKGRTEAGPRELPSRSFSTGQNCGPHARTATHTRRATQMHTYTTNTAHMSMLTHWQHLNTNNLQSSCQNAQHNNTLLQRPNTLTSRHTAETRLCNQHTNKKQRPRRQHIITPDRHTEQNHTKARHPSKAPTNTTDAHTRHCNTHPPNTAYTGISIIHTKMPTHDAHILRDNNQMQINKLASPMHPLPSVHTLTTPHLRQFTDPQTASHHPQSLYRFRQPPRHHPQRSHAHMVQNTAVAPGTHSPQPHPPRPQECGPGP